MPHDGDGLYIKFRVFILPVQFKLRIFVGYAKNQDMITRCYLEITNVCNLDCVFCPKTTRAKHTMTMDEFDMLTSRLVGEVRFLYFHLMGEPFLHPLLPQFVLTARCKGFIPVLTTNGTLLSQRTDMLDALPHKLQISLHSHEGNGKENFKQYIDEVMTFAGEAARRGCVVDGTVKNSVLFTGAKVAAGAKVIDSVLMPGAEVAEGAVVTRALVADGIKIGKNAVVGDAASENIELVAKRVKGDE